MSLLTMLPASPSLASGQGEAQHSAIAFLQAALAYFRSLGIALKSIMTDNGACDISKRLAQACRAAGLRHFFTRPYRPQTNGKAERFIQTSLREWAWARSYQHSTVRAAHLPLLPSSRFRLRRIHGWHEPGPNDYFFPQIRSR